VTARPADFPPDYASARGWFRAAATSLGWTLHAHTIPGTGPSGEELSIDAANSPHSDASKVVVVSSGLHGVEAPFGSAVQLAMFERFASAPPPPGLRFVFLHALNPWGYAWGRRVDADNVDPNRNFLLPGEEYQGSPEGYRHFDALLNPRSPLGRFDLFVPKAWLAVARFGVPALRQALVGGQYDYPQGVFFGGHRPSATHLGLQQRLRGWIGPAAEVVHLDFHTGLGPWGGYKLLLDAPVSKLQLERMGRWFGPGTHEEDDPTKTSYRPRGGFGPWCVAQQIAPEYLYMVAEFGTYKNIPMLAGMRQENRAVHWGQRGERIAERAKARLRDLFIPPSLEWRQRVLEQGVQLVLRAAAGLASVTSA
jgi:Protein of unknown function (DUF2817)